MVEAFIVWIFPQSVTASGNLPQCAVRIVAGSDAGRQRGSTEHPRNWISGWVTPCRILIAISRSWPGTCRSKPAMLPD